MRYGTVEIPYLTHIRDFYPWGRFHERFTRNFILRWTVQTRILPNYKKIVWISHSNNFVKHLCNRARCILIYNFLELGEIHVLKVHHKIRSLVNRSSIRLLICSHLILLLQYLLWDVSLIEKSSGIIFVSLLKSLIS